MNTARLQTPEELKPTQHGFRIPAPPADIVRKPLQADAPNGQPMNDLTTVGAV